MTTGVPGLDQVLGGGLFEGGAYLVAGQAGTGKTVLGSQLCFHHVAHGGRALFVTLLSESHARLIAHLRGMRFFDEQAVGDALYYINGFSALEHEGLEGLLSLLRRSQRERAASLLVLDGLSSVEGIGGTGLPLKRFVTQLQGVASTTNCTVLLLTEHVSRDSPAHAMVDGILFLEDVREGMRARRSVSVGKLRGAPHLRGAHLFEIDEGGLRVYPRVEARWPHEAPRRRTEPPRQLSLGVERLDRMLGGGLVEGTATMVLGSPGCGKTLLGLQFLVAGAAQGERGLHFGFHESEEQLLRQAAGIGCDLAGAVRRGLVRVERRAPLELQLDRVCDELVEAVRAHGARRVFFDGISGLEEGALGGRERLPTVLVALSDELRAHGITLVMTAETFDVVGGSVRLPVGGMSAMVDNTLFLRTVEVGSSLHRALSVLKVRERAFDPTIREFVITGEGFRVGEPFGRAESILTGQSHRLPPEAGDDLSPTGAQARGAGNGHDSHR